MSNEEKILSLLTKMQADIDSMKETLKPYKPTKEEQLAALRGLTTMLTDEEKFSFGQFMDEQEARKVALYG